MKKDRKITNSQLEKLKEPPFRVPEGYFDRLADRLQDRIREEDASRIPVRRLYGASKFRIVMAAALVGLALVTYSLFKFTSLGGNSNGSFPEMVLLEQLEVFDDDLYLYDLIGEADEELDDEEAFAVQAIEYLAINDTDMALLFE